jgi:hypothetical protein
MEPVPVMLETELERDERDEEEDVSGCVRRMTHIARARPVMPAHSCGMIERISSPRPGLDMEDRERVPPNAPGATLAEDFELTCARTRVRVESELLVAEDDGRE